MARRDRINNASAYDFVRQFAVAPLTDRSTGVGWLLACQRDDLAHLLRGEFRWRTGSRAIGQSFSDAELFQRHVTKLQPAPSPVAWGLVVNTQLSSNLQVVPPIASQKHDLRSQRQLLPRRKSADQAVQPGAFLRTQHHFRRYRRGHRVFRSNQDA
jgi:hypothetical protein